MSDFMSDDIFLSGATAKRLYSTAKALPICDFHCHLSPAEIYDDKKYFNLTELWLSGDHYKWRLMRAAGVDERYITGDAADKDKFLRFAEILPSFPGNPVYQWAHFELKKYFGLAIPISADTAELIWSRTECAMLDGSFSARKLIEKSNVKYIVTTDDPVDDLHYHQMLRAENLPFTVLPCFRTDKLVNLNNDGFGEYVQNLAVLTDSDVDGWDSLTAAVDKRFDYFVQNGAVAADVSFADFPQGDFDAHKACLALQKRLSGFKLTAEEEDSYKFCMLSYLAKKFKKAEIVMQMHVGVIRNCSTALFATAGADAGGDSVGNAVNIAAARNLLDYIDGDGGLPKTMIYTLNPNSYYPLATLIGDFQRGGRGRLQLGAAWWFMDHKDGIKEVLKITSATSGLGLFNGMLTDSRSFTSYARHDYFRRILCSTVGGYVDKGEYPDDKKLLDWLIADVCYNNAYGYFIGDKK